jgi:hypothetical protein
MLDFFRKRRISCANDVHLVGLLQLLIGHELDGIKRQIPQEERAVAGKEPPRTLPPHNSLHCSDRASELPCMTSRSLVKQQWVGWVFISMMVIEARS